MEALNLLITKLDQTEVNLVRNYLTHMNVRDKGDQKLLGLFNFLVKSRGKDPDADKCAMNVYGAKADGRFRALKFKLRSRIIDALISDKNVERDNILDERMVAGLKLRKKAAFLNYLFNSKGNSAIVIETIEEILSSGLKQEGYLTMIEALKTKKYIKAFTSNIDTFDEINKQIAFYEYCDQARSKANDYYYKVITRKDFRASFNQKELHKYLQECILELNKDYKYTGSGMVGYYLKLLEFSYFQEKGDYNSARNSGLELLTIIREKKSVYRKQRVGIAFDNIGECDVFLGEYQKAISNFRAAQKFFPENSVNLIVSKECELNVLLYSNEFAEAERVLNEILEKGNVDAIGKFKEAKFPFYKANLLFQMDHYKEALKEIAQQSELTEDKTGWGIWVRVLGIMCNIELERYDDATLQINNLKRHIERSENETEQLSPRNKMIVNVLFRLSAAGFMYTDVDAKTIDALAQLSSDKKLSWKPFGPEVIKFHEWMGAKVPGFAKIMNGHAQQKAKVEKKQVLVKR